MITPFGLTIDTFVIIVGAVVFFVICAWADRAGEDCIGCGCRIGSSHGNDDDSGRDQTDRSRRA